MKDLTETSIEKDTNASIENGSAATCYMQPSSATNMAASPGGSQSSLPHHRSPKDYQLLQASPHQLPQAKIH